MLVVAHQSIARDGEHHCGDTAVWRRTSSHHLVAVVDALGHGEGAELVADKALQHLHVAAITSAGEVLAGLHEALKGTRGAAAMVAIFDGRRLEASGVGNVELRGLTRALPIAPVPGILGGRTHPFRSGSIELHYGDRFAMFSDGISRRADLRQALVLPPREACTTILRDHRNANDDATLLVAEVASSPTALRGST